MSDLTPPNSPNPPPNSPLDLPPNPPSGQSSKSETPEKPGLTLPALEFVHNAEPDGGDGVVATILRRRWDDNPNGTDFVTDSSQPLQVAHMRRSVGTYIPPHFHLERKRVITQTQEVLIIRRGIVQIDFYTAAGDRFDIRVLTDGDTCILHQGGHALKFLTDAVMIEVKQGPYSGKDLDKTILFERLKGP